MRTLRLRARGVRAAWSLSLAVAALPAGAGSDRSRREAPGSVPGAASRLRIDWWARLQALRQSR